MKTAKYSSMAGLFALLMLVAATAFATPVTIVNSGFESNVLNDGAYTTNAISGWTVINSGDGVWNPTAAYFPAGLPSGSNVAYLNTGGIVSQTLTDTLAANMTYTLQVGVGWRFDIGAPNYVVELLAGGNILATNSLTPLLKNGFVNTTLVYNTLAGNPFLGQHLEIRLVNLGGTQVDFDNVSLTAVDPPPAGSGPTPTPEPGTLLMVGAGLAGLGLRRWRKNKA